MSNPLYEDLAEIALELVSDFGSLVVWTHSAPGRTLTTGRTAAPVKTTYSGAATEMEESDPDLYAAMGLVQGENPLILYTPENYGKIPPPGATGFWAKEKWTIKAVKKYRPDDTALLAYLGLQR